MNLTEDIVRTAVARAEQIATTPKVCWYACDATTPRNKVLVITAGAIAGAVEWYIIHPDDFAEIERETAGLVQWRHVREFRSEPKEQRTP